MKVDLSPITKRMEEALQLIVTAALADMTQQMHIALMSESATAVVGKPVATPPRTTETTPPESFERKRRVRGAGRGKRYGITTEQVAEALSKVGGPITSETLRREHFPKVSSAALRRRLGELIEAKRVVASGDKRQRAYAVARIGRVALLPVPKAPRARVRKAPKAAPDRGGPARRKARKTSKRKR